MTDSFDPLDYVPRVKAALMEAGYPDMVLYDPESPNEMHLAADVPAEVVWRAFTITGLNDACWPCWIAHVEDDPADGWDCDHDWRAETQPEVVRR